LARTRTSPNGGTIRQSKARSSDPAVSKWQERREQARRDRARYEPIWHMCHHYLAGRQWIGWAERERRIISLHDHPDWRHRERHTVNVLTSHVWNTLARVISDDLRPDITFRRDDIESERFAEQARRAWQYSWQEEVGADDALLITLLKEFTYGTAATRCYFDPTEGAELGELPLDDDGRPITNPQEAMAYVAQAQMEGRRVRFDRVKEGRSIWEPLSPFNIFPPPGVERECDFPWLIIERPFSIEAVQRMFTSKAKNLVAQDLTSTDMAASREPGVSDDPFGSSSGKLEDHVLLSTGYEYPCPEYPNGQTTTWCKDTLLARDDKLPYMIDGVPTDGISFFHYHRIPGRFWAQGIVEPGMGIQRQINRARSQQIEMKDRNMGRVYAHVGTVTEANKPVGKINELIEVQLGHQFPVETQGIPPGPWIQAEAEIGQMDLNRVLGVSDVSRGLAPQGVSAYSALALLSEQSERTIEPIIKMTRKSIIKLAKATLHNIRLYWPSSKQIAIAGDDGLYDAFIFESAQLPESVFIIWPEGPPRPRSQAAEIQKIFDLYDRSVAGGRPLPIGWLKDSLEAVKAQEIPEIPGQAQQHKAELENMLLARGQMIAPAQYDDDVMHIEIHRAAQTAHDLLPGAEQVRMIFDQHIQQHVYAQQMKMMMALQSGALMQSAMQMPMPGQGGAAGGGGGGPAGLPPPFPGAEQTASQRGPMGPAGSPNIPQ
jgi:hypothetical protein